MIKVVSFKQDSLSLDLRLKVMLYQEKKCENTIGDAYDLICNSVSVLSQSTLIGMDEVLKLNSNYEIKMDSYHWIYLEF